MMLPPAYAAWRARVAHARGAKAGRELRAGEQLLAVRLGKGAEHAAAGRIDQHLDLGLLLLEQGLIGIDAAQIREIERDRADGVRALVAQLLQPLISAGNDPDLVIARVLVHSVDELPADTGGCAGDDSNVHTFSSRMKISVTLSYRTCAVCARDWGIKNRCERCNVRSNMKISVLPDHFIKTRTHYKIETRVKKERQQVFYLLSALETVPEIAVRSAILFSGGISPSPSFHNRMGLIFLFCSA